MTEEKFSELVENLVKLKPSDGLLSIAKYFTRQLLNLSFGHRLHSSHCPGLRLKLSAEWSVT